MGFEMLQLNATSFLADVPKVWEYLAHTIEPIFEGGVVGLHFLQGLARILGPSVAPDFVATVLIELVNAPV